MPPEGIVDAVHMERPLTLAHTVALAPAPAAAPSPHPSAPTIKRRLNVLHYHLSHCLLHHLAYFHLVQGGVSAIGSPARAGTVCSRFHLMFALTHFPIRTSTCSLQYIEYYLDS
jgi:hypothetical protein